MLPFKRIPCTFAARSSHPPGPNIQFDGYSEERARQAIEDAYNVKLQSMAMEASLAKKPIAARESLIQYTEPWARHAIVSLWENVFFESRKPSPKILPIYVHALTRQIRMPQDLLSISCDWISSTVIADLPCLHDIARLLTCLDTQSSHGISEVFEPMLPAWRIEYRSNPRAFIQYHFGTGREMSQLLAFRSRYISVIEHLSDTGVVKELIDEAEERGYMSGY